MKSAPSWVNPIPVALPKDGPQDHRMLLSRVPPTLAGFERCVIVAESYSGPLAVLAARHLGDRVDLLVMANSFLVSPLGFLGRLAPWKMAAQLPASETAVRCMLTGGDRDLAREVVEELAGLPRTTIAARLAAVSRVDVSAEYSQLACAVLILRGTEDRLIGFASAARMKSLRPEAELVELDSPHLLFQLVPEKAWEVISGHTETAA